MSLLRNLLLAGAVLISAPVMANAAQITQTASTANGAYSGTDFDLGLTFNKFNPTSGTLNSIDFTLAGNILGDIRLESLDAQATTLTSRLRATITLERPDGSSITFNVPVAMFSDSATAYDGTTDYGGTSGFSHLNASASGSSTLTADTSATDLALFTGTGTITLVVDASGTSTASGAGNLQTNFRTTAEANATVTYNYTAAATPPTTVPEPASLALLGLGVVGAGLVRRRRS